MQQVFARWGSYGSGNGTLRKRGAIDDWRGWNLAINVLPDGASKSVKGLVCRLNKKGRELNAHADVAQWEEMAIRFDILPQHSDEVAGYDLNKVAQFARSAMDLAAKGPSKGQIDFADMIFLPIYHGWIRPKYSTVIVDEYQDMSPMQLLMAQQLAKDGLIVVGDDRQGIYGFRGADTTFAQRIREEMSADELTLNVSFRCPKRVAEVARGIVSDFEAHGNNADGEVVELDDTDYSQLIELAEEGDVILSRYNAPMVGIVLRLLRAGKPACIKGRRNEVEGFKKTVKLLVEGCNGTMPAVVMFNDQEEGDPDEVTQLLSNLYSWHAKEIDRIYSSGAYNKEPLIDALDDRVATLRALWSGNMNPWFKISPSRTKSQTGLPEILRYS